MGHPLATRVDSRNKCKKTSPKTGFCLFSSGGRTRTSGLRVMSPTSYQLLYPAMWNAKIVIIFNIAKFSFKIYRPFPSKQQHHE